MTDRFYRLTFVAIRRWTQDSLSPVEKLNQHYERARRFDGLGLTGLLFEHGDRLLYCMEGTEPAVSQQYEAIKRDPDVRGVTVLCQDDEELRDFRRWGFALADDPRGGQSPSLEYRVVQMVLGAPEEIRRIFLAFARLPMGRIAA